MNNIDFVNDNRLIGFTGTDTDIIIPDCYTSIGEGAFENSEMKSVIIQGNIKTIHKSAFAYSRNLRNVILSDGILSIGDYAFYNCSELRSIIIPASIKSIGEFAFANCDVLTVEFRDGVSVIGASAFANCKSLKEIVLPLSVSTVCSGAFKGCTALEKVIIQNSNTIIEPDAFDDVSVTYAT